MENKCLITVFKGVVDKDNLSVLNTLTMKVKKALSISTQYYQRGFSVYSSTEDVFVKVRGNGHFNLVGEETQRTEIIIPAGSHYDFMAENEDFYIDIKSKYPLEEVSLHAQATFPSILSFNIDELQFSNINKLKADFSGSVGHSSALKDKTDMTVCQLEDTDVVVELSDFTNLVNLTDFNIPSSSTGDLSSISNLTKVKKLLLTNYKNITGSLSSLSSMTDLEVLYIRDTYITGDISSIGDCTKMRNFTASNANVNGNISSLGKLTSLKTLVLPLNVEGSLEDLASAQVQSPNNRTSGTLAVTGNNIVTYKVNNVDTPFTGVKTITFNSSLPNGYSIS